MRPAVRRIQTHGATTDAQRGQLGITIPDQTRTPVTPPTSRPLVRVEWGARLEHILRFSDEATPTRRAKPPGMVGAEVWVKVTAPGEAPGPADGGAALPGVPAAYRFVRLATRSPARVEYGSSDAGRTAHYMLRWLTRRGAKGPWSETASATVGG